MNWKMYVMSVIIKAYVEETEPWSVSLRAADSLL